MTIARPQSLHPVALGYGTLTSSLHPDVLDIQPIVYGPQSIHPDVLNGPPYGPAGLMASYLTQFEIEAYGGSAIRLITTNKNITASVPVGDLRMRAFRSSDQLLRQSSWHYGLNFPLTSGSYCIVSSLNAGTDYDIKIRLIPDDTSTYEDTGWLDVIDNWTFANGIINVTPPLPPGYQS